MPELLQYGFMVRALIAGIMVALTIPTLGSFLVARRYSLIADSLAHMSLAGVGAGLLLGFAPVLIAVPVTVAGALALEWLRQKRQVSGEVSLAILMSSGLAVAVVLANLSHGVNADFTSYLFGSITTTSQNDLVVLAIAAFCTLAVLLGRYQAFLHIAFDEDSARIAGYSVEVLNYLLVTMTAVMVVLSLRIVGGLLLSALLVMPVVTASRFGRSFATTMLLAIVAALFAVLVGLIVAFYVGIAAGGAIVLSALALLILAMIWKG